MCTRTYVCALAIEKGPRKNRSMLPLADQGYSVDKRWVRASYRVYVVERVCVVI